MIPQLTAIFTACALGLIIFPGAWLIVLAIERYIDSCPNGKD